MSGERDYASELAEAFKESTPIGETAKLDVLHAELVARLEERSRAVKSDKIELHAVYRKNGSVLICDQDAREFEARSEHYLLYGGSDGTIDEDAVVLMEVTLEAPRDWRRKPRVALSLNIPLNVEERLPVWMQEYLAGRG